MIHWLLLPFRFLYHSFVLLGFVCVVVNFCAAFVYMSLALSLIADADADAAAAAATAAVATAAVAAIVFVIVMVGFSLLLLLVAVGCWLSMRRLQMYISMQDAPLIVHVYLVNAVALFEKEQVFHLGFITIKFVDYLNGYDDI